MRTQHLRGITANTTMLILFSANAELFSDKYSLIAEGYTKKDLPMEI